jgi:hypothetical protein
LHAKIKYKNPQTIMLKAIDWNYGILKTYNTKTRFLIGGEELVAA